ncbi:MAG: hypothetical protein K6G83_03635 [Lachnospiraceae bacterium]|nr:hypothetical protein [Lachnospiraceae bacterium]
MSKRITAVLLAGAVFLSGSFSGLFTVPVKAAEAEGEGILSEEMVNEIVDIILALLGGGAVAEEGSKEAEPEAEPAAETKDEQPAETETVQSEDALSDLPTEWDLTELFADEAAFDADMDYLAEHASDLEAYRGTLNNADAILAITEDENILKLDDIYYRGTMYSAFLSSLDASDPWAKHVAARVQDGSMKYTMSSAFVTPEIMALPLEEREKIFSDERLAPYAYYYRRYTDPDWVTLSEETTQAEALLGTAADQSYNAYFVFDNVENKRPEITYPDGTVGTLTDEAYSQIMDSNEYDHDFRKEANLLRAAIRKPYENTYAELLAGEMKRNWAEAQIHGYDSTLAYFTDMNDVDPEIFYQIIDFAHSILPKFHAYYALRKERLGLEEIGTYDLTLPLNDYSVPLASYEDCVNLGREAIKSWGDEYLDTFDRIMTSGHIDAYPSDTKEGGAYEWLLGNKTLPYVMYNYDGTLGYVNTIVHEMGHAIYSEFSRENQNIYNCCPGIFTQEVASTTNELVLYKQLVENAADQEEREYWLDKEIELYANTLLFQCMLAEFEDYCYKTLEAGEALSPAAMNEKYVQLLETYFGDAVDILPEQGIDWARIPHFYKGYYVYQYATSLTFATAICEKVSEDESEKEAYLNFLKAGCSAAPADLLKIACVDPADPATYESAKAYVEDLVDQLLGE